jgi:hypothetical protein
LNIHLARGTTIGKGKRHPGVGAALPPINQNLNARLAPLKRKRKSNKRF